MSKLSQLGKATAAIMAALIAPQVGRAELSDAVGYIENAGVPSAVVPDFIGQKLFDTTGSVFYIAFGTSAGQWAVMGNDALSAAELEVLDGVTPGTAAASKAMVLGTTKNIDSFRMTGKLFTPQAAPETSADTASLTDAQMLSGILVATPTAAAAYTTRTGTQIEAALLAAGFQVQTGDCFDLTIINIGGTGDDITFTAGADVSIIGDAVVRPSADSGTEQAGQGTFRLRRSAANTFVAYRVS